MDGHGPRKAVNGHCAWRGSTKNHAYSSAVGLTDYRLWSAVYMLYDHNGLPPMSDARNPDTIIDIARLSSSVILSGHFVTSASSPLRTCEVSTACCMVLPRRLVLTLCSQGDCSAAGDGSCVCAYGERFDDNDNLENLCRESRVRTNTVSVSRNLGLRY